MRGNDYKIIVALYLKGDTLDPEYISKTLCITPSKTQIKGQKNITSTGHEFISKIGMWSLIADSHSNNVSDHINWLVSNTAKVGKNLNSLPGVDAAYVDIFIATLTDEDGEGVCNFELDQTIISDLSKLEIPIRFTVETTHE